MEQKFFWGAATSAHQVEGGNHNDWTEWEQKTAQNKAQIARGKTWPDYVMKNYPNPTQVENYISGHACDHYNRFREDFDIAKQLGHNAHRFSIEWSRIEPEEGKWNEKEIEHYREVIKALRERGLEPFVTLWHWTQPVWLSSKNGVLHKNFPEYFSRYAEKIVGELKEVKFWTTVNEPEIFALNSYLRGLWPPQRKSIVLFYRCTAQLIRAHRRAYDVIKGANNNSHVGIAVNLSHFESVPGIINRVIKFFVEPLWNFHFLRHARQKLDFIGLNYYFHNRINYGFNKNENALTSDMRWEIYPKGIYHVLKSLTPYNLPVYITENGLADARDALRTVFIQEHIRWMKKALAEGVDVHGYFHWSLLDNFEWDKGFWPRFGLVEIDYKTMERKIRPSALVYKKIILGSRF